MRNPGGTRIGHLFTGHKNFFRDPDLPHTPNEFWTSPENERKPSARQEKIRTKILELASSNVNKECVIFGMLKGCYVARSCLFIYAPHPCSLDKSLLLISYSIYLHVFIGEIVSPQPV